MFGRYALRFLPIRKVRRINWICNFSLSGKSQQGRQTELIIYGGLALLFQPFFKIALGREIWNIVDVIVGIGLLISIFMKPKESQP